MTPDSEHNSMSLDTGPKFLNIYSSIISFQIKTVVNITLNISAETLLPYIVFSEFKSDTMFPLADLHYTWTSNLPLHMHY